MFNEHLRASGDETRPVGGTRSRRSRMLAPKNSIFWPRYAARRSPRRNGLRGIERCARAGSRRRQLAGLHLLGHADGRRVAQLSQAHRGHRAGEQRRAEDQVQSRRHARDQRDQHQFGDQRRHRPDRGRRLLSRLDPDRRHVGAAVPVAQHRRHEQADADRAPARRARLRQEGRHDARLVTPTRHRCSGSAAT